MKITLLVVGQTDSPFVKKGIGEYLKRLHHSIRVEMKILPDPRRGKSIGEEIRKKIEGEQILAHLSPSTTMVLLDKTGASFSSVAFSAYLQKKMASGLKELIFVVGGPYGFSEEVYQAVKEKISLSPMTFPHDLVRLIFVEQLYRAYTIMNGEPYHHE
jgi:23S rRNA (pseudouridine1915-N3)-methyltransferase